MAVETYGVTQTIIQSYLGQLTITSVSPVTPSRLTSIIEGAAARLNAALIRSFGSSAPADIATDTASDAYRNCQRVVVMLAIPDILLSQHYTGAADVVAGLRDNAEAALQGVVTDPVGAIGHVTSEPRAPGVYSSTIALDLDTTTEVARSRRYWDGRRGLKDDGGFIW